MNRSPIRRLGIERLEPRHLMAGNITAAVVGEDLIITGDDQANSLTFETTSTHEWALTGNDTTVNGLNTSQTPVKFSGVTGNLIARLGAGEDWFLISTFYSPLNVRKALILDTGPGNDTAHLFGPGGAQIETQLVVDLGEGHDTFSALYFGTGTDKIVRGGSGNDSITMGLNTSRDLAIFAGEGFDFVRIQSDQVRNSMLLDGGSEADRIEVTGDFGNDSAVFGREGSDAIYALGARAAKTFLISAGSGFAYIEVRHSVLDGRTYLINEGPCQMNLDASAFDRLELFVGPENDFISITRCAVEELFASLGEASDGFKLIASRVNRGGRIDGQGGFDLFAQGDNVVTNLEVVGFEFFPPPQSFMQP